MDYQQAVATRSGVLLTNILHFHPRHVFECGQCFRWSRVDPEVDTHYRGVVAGKVLEVELRGADLLLRGTTLAEFRDSLCHYFDLHRDYGAVKAALSKDPVLRDPVAFGHGIRVLNQEPFETLISFILSANNGIKKIQEGIRRISAAYGLPIQGDAHAFPTPKALSRATVEDLYALGVGYRAKYIHAAAKVLAAVEGAREQGTLPGDQGLLHQDLGFIATLPEDAAREALQGFSGVGPKVADCILLFSMEKSGVFPVDVWVKKALVHYYGVEAKGVPALRAFARERFGDHAGFAQQYLFYHAREHRIRL